MRRMRVLRRWRSQVRTAEAVEESQEAPEMRDERAAEATEAAMAYITAVARGMARRVVSRK
jgi:hypothetical protein